MAEPATACPKCSAPTSAGVRFCGSCGAALQSPTASEAADELRPVTALFADVVGSTALGEHLAPDEVKTLMGECVSRLSRAVEEYGGMVQAYLGDGICAYFGVPAAHEDDPERAARAALRILEVVREYWFELEAAWGLSEFNVRIGINSGQTAVGLVGSGDRQPVALGDTTNVAARLQGSAAPGTICVGEATARALEHRFELEPLGGIPLRGRDEPVQAWRLVRARVRASPSPAFPLVGRDAELERLRAEVEGLTQAGRGRVLFLRGEAGMGKTRLLQEVRAIAGEDVVWLQGDCLSYGGLVLWPFIDMLRSWLGVGPDDPEVLVRTKTRARLGALLGARSSEALPALLRLLKARLEPDEDRELPAPADLAAAIRAAYRTWIAALAEHGPVIVAIEDLHWADPSARAVAEELLSLTDGAPLLLAFTLRPGQSEGARLRLHALAEFAHRTIDVVLEPLSEDAARRLLHLSLPGLVEEAAMSEVLSRAEGNPLFLHELLRSLVQGGGLRRGRSWTLTARAAGYLPQALENLLVARIDLLPDGARRLAQIAAVIGRSFPVRVLARLAPDGFEADLAVLLREEVIQELRRLPERSYVFKHALLQEASLSTLTPARHRSLHARVAATFEELFEPSLDEHLELLAHLYVESGELQKALAYLQQSADKAEGLDAQEEGAELRRRAAKVAARLGDGSAPA